MISGNLLMTLFLTPHTSGIFAYDRKYLLESGIKIFSFSPIFRYILADLFSQGRCWEFADGRVQYNSKRGLERAFVLWKEPNILTCKHGVLRNCTAFWRMSWINPPKGFSVLSSRCDGKKDPTRCHKECLLFRSVQNESCGSSFEPI